MTTITTTTDDPQIVRHDIPDLAALNVDPDEGQPDAAVTVTIAGMKGEVLRYVGVGAPKAASPSSAAISPTDDPQDDEETDTDCPVEWRIPGSATVAARAHLRQHRRVYRLGMSRLSSCLARLRHTDVARLAQ